MQGIQIQQQLQEIRDSVEQRRHLEREIAYIELGLRRLKDDIDSTLIRYKDFENKVLKAKIALFGIQGFLLIYIYILSTLTEALSSWLRVCRNPVPAEWSRLKQSFVELKPTNQVAGRDAESDPYRFGRMPRREWPLCRSLYSEKFRVL
ncbi:unnamed protein product [Thelazia callipaeda]|uniref:DUF4200 domain-containing protein n=1 Tax=Thelazia callipaeda TaxID=103827 RepID=A0A0N5D0X0_THECL|nr:unnamed protein product [Thelazia callipaeda]